MSDSEDDDDHLQGLARPTLSAAAAADDDDDESDSEGQPPEPASGAAADAKAESDSDGESSEEEEEENASGLVSANAAFADPLGTASLELDPFRVARGADIAVPDDAAGPKKGGGSKKADVTRIFVGGLPLGTTEEQLFKVFARYGKVKTAAVVERQAASWFGFITFVKEASTRFVLSEAGDPPQIDFKGTAVTVSYADKRETHNARVHKMPARGDVSYLGKDGRGRLVAEQRERQFGSGRGQGGSGAHGGGGSGSGEVGVSTIAQAYRRAPGAVDLPVSDDEADNGDGGGVSRKKQKKKAKEIVTVSRRQDAEPLNKRPITMKEIFPKEFWRI